MSNIHIQLPAALSDRASGATSVTVEAGSVADALSALERRHPDVGQLLFDNRGQVRPHVHLFVESKQVRAEPGETLSDGDELRIVPSIAGG